MHTKTQSGSYEDLKAGAPKPRKIVRSVIFPWICMNHSDVGGYYAWTPLIQWVALCTTSVVSPVIRTTPEDTRIQYFLVMGKRKKRVAIVAQNISEKRDEKKTTGYIDLCENWVNE